MQVSLVHDASSSAGTGSSPLKKIKVSLLDDALGPEGEQHQETVITSSSLRPKPSAAVNNFMVEEKNVCRVKECVGRGMSVSCSLHLSLYIYIYIYKFSRILTRLYEQEEEDASM
jgi:hypothetical protein